MFLKIKIKQMKDLNVSESEEFVNEYYFDSGIDVKIEGIFLDVTQNYLKKETQNKSYMLAKYIHEIKSPLHLLQQMIENYKSYVKKTMREISLFNENKKSIHKINNDKFEQNEYLNNLKILTKHIFEIIENINNFSKMQNNLMGHNPQPVIKKIDVRKLINRCLDYFKIYTKFNNSKKNIRVYSEIEGHVPQFIESNKRSLKHILMNLLTNSMKFTNQGEIKVVCKPKSKLELLDSERKFLEVNVIDTGVGIDEENLDNICKPFSLTTSKEKEGSGLGLSIVVDLLTSIKSKLSIYSVKNKGSNFSFELSLGEKTEVSPKLINNKIAFSQLIENINVKNPYVSEQKNLNKIILNENENLQSNTESSNFGLTTPLSDEKTITLDKPIDISGHSDNYYRNSKIENMENSPAENCSPIKIKARRNSQPTDPTVRIKRNYSSKPVSNKNRNININIFENTSDHLSSEEHRQRNLIKNKKINLTNKSKQQITGDYSFRIIIFDDDPIYASLMKNQIYTIQPDLNCKLFIDTAPDPIEGLYKIYFNLKEQNILYDLIFIDENMPFINGSTFIRMYKDLLQTNGFYKVPFISISSDAEKRLDLKGYVDDQLNKPCRKKDLKYILEKYIKQSKQY